MGILRFNRPVINVSDMDKSLAFYRDILGMEVVSDNLLVDPERTKALGQAMGVPELEIRWVIIESPGGSSRFGVGREVEIIQFLKPAWKPVSPHPNAAVVGVPIAWPAFSCDNLEALYNELKSKGVKFRGSLMKFATGDRGLCYAIDPDGYTVELGGTL